MYDYDIRLDKALCVRDRIDRQKNGMKKYIFKNNVIYFYRFL